MISYSNIPTSCNELFSFLSKEDEFSGFIYGADFKTEDEGLAYLFTIISDLESHVKEDSNKNLLLFHKKYNFWVKVTAYPGQDKIVFNRIFTHH